MTAKNVESFLKKYWEENYAPLLIGFVMGLVVRELLVVVLIGGGVYLLWFFLKKQKKE